MAVLVLIVYLAIVGVWICAVLGLVAAPFVLVWLAAVAIVRRVRRRHARPFA